MEQIKLAIDSLKNGKTLVQKLNKIEILVTTANAVVLRTTRDGIARETGNFEELLLAAKVNGAIVGNSERLQTSDFKDIVNIIQRPMSDLIPMIPFSSLKEAGLSLKEYKEVDKGNEETVYVKVPEHRLSLIEFNEKHVNKKGASIRNVEETWKGTEYGYGTWFETRHFTGARLFKVGTEHFLMDIDRREIEHGIFNAFLVKLVGPANTIAEAYEMLKPQAVKDAETQGLKVKRQGEWFFIPTNTVPMAKPENMALRAGDNRPNWVDEGVNQDGTSFVKGEVTHAGREHEPIQLEGWHIAMPNTSITSWQLDGNID